MRTVVLGVGNPLMGDDGLGIAAVEALRRDYSFAEGVELVDGGTWGMNLLPVIETAERLLILDAINAGLEPGVLVRLSRDELPRLLAHKMSPHQIDLKEVLALAELRGNLPAEALALGLQPAVIEMDDRLSPGLAAGLPHLVEGAVACLREWGHQVTSLAGAAS